MNKDLEVGAISARGRTIKNTNIGNENVNIKLSDWVYGFFTVVEGMPIILNKEGSGKIALVVEIKVNNIWVPLDLVALRKKYGEE